MAEARINELQQQIEAERVSKLNEEIGDVRIAREQKLMVSGFGRAGVG